MPTAMLLDHSNTFTPLNQNNNNGNNNNINVNVTRQRASQEVDNISGYLDEDSNDNISNDNHHPYTAEEILRQKIEETNQKISDYFA